MTDQANILTNGSRPFSVLDLGYETRLAQAGRDFFEQNTSDYREK